MFEEQIARGAEFLDEQVGPHWPLLIDLDKLEMSDCRICMIGQTLGEEAFWEIWSMYGGPQKSGLATAQWYGFMIQLGQSHEDWKGLGDEWTVFIKDRLDKGIVV